MGEHRRDIDIAVIGAGVLGLATTDSLVRRGADVVCFDGRVPGSGRSAARRPRGGSDTGRAHHRRAWTGGCGGRDGRAQASRSLSPTTPAMIATTQASRAADAASPWTMPAVTTPAAPMPTQTA